MNLSEYDNILPYDEKGVLSGKAYTIDKKTFYSRNGDYIARISILLSVLLLLISFSKVKELENSLVFSSYNLFLQKISFMYWTLELASYLSDAPWPASKDELIDFSIRTGAPLEVVENLQSLEDEGDVYESIQEIWPDFPTEEDYLWNEDEY